MYAVEEFLKDQDNIFFRDGIATLKRHWVI